MNVPGWGSGLLERGESEGALARPCSASLPASWRVPSGAGPAPASRTHTHTQNRLHGSGWQTSPAPGGFPGKVRCLRPPSPHGGGGAGEVPRSARGEGLWAPMRGVAAGADPQGRMDSGRGGDGRAGGRRSRPGAGPAPPAAGAADTRGWAGGVQMRWRRRGARAAEEEPSPRRGRRREPRRQESRDRFPSFSRLPA